MRNLDGASGKVFRVDPAARSFEFLTETEFDPKTNEGRSRFTVFWTEGTRFTRIDTQESFAGVEGPVLAEFHWQNRKNAEAAAGHEPFVCRSVTVRPEADAALGFSDDLARLVARLTPSPDDRLSGFARIDGRDVKATLTRQGARVEVHSHASESEINQGFWEAAVRGKTRGEDFVAESMEIRPLPDPRETDDPALPRVLVVGDSISMNYHDAAKAELAGVANYHRVDGNCGPSDRGVACMELWLGDYEQRGLHWDLIQFNHGLHDLKQYYDKETETYGAHQVELEDYKANLEKEVAIMRPTGAKMMWCSTTPVPRTYFGNFPQGLQGRRKDEDLVYNEAAMEVVSRHPDIMVNDLNRAVRESRELDEWRKGKDVHFWDRAQQEVVGKAVAFAVRKALGKR